MSALWRARSSAWTPGTLEKPFADRRRVSLVTCIACASAIESPISLEGHNLRGSIARKAEMRDRSGAASCGVDIASFRSEDLEVSRKPDDGCEWARRSARRYALSTDREYAHISCDVDCGQLGNDAATSSVVSCSCVEEGEHKAV